MTITRGALLSVLLAAMVCPHPVEAASYEVWSCNLPDGTNLPVEGWAPERNGTNTATPNGCSDFYFERDGGLHAAFTGDTSGGQYAGWVFNAPTDTTISAYTLWRSAHTAASADAFQDYILTHDIPRTLDSRYLAEFCSPYVMCSGSGDASDPLANANRVQRSNLQIRRIHAFMSCDAINGETRCDSSRDTGRFTLYSARVALEDPYRPELTGAPEGSLLVTGAPLEGEKTISFDARDRGGGIEQVGVAVDGQLRLSRPADPKSTRCRRPFSALKPCSAAATSTLVFDTAQVANGTHTVQAAVIDAAGNETRSDPVTVTTRNHSLPNGRGASRFVRLSAWLRSRRDARRRATIVPYGSVRFAEGRLTDATGAPIAGAVLDVKSRVQRPGARHKRAGSVTTGEDGRFVYRIARGASRTLRFEYKAYTLDPAPVSSAAVSLGVRAGIRLKLKPRRVRNGERIRFLGRLKGGPARKGTRVTIDVVVPDARRRVPIGNVKADAKGRFRFAYRFRRTLVKARYRFQARLVPQPGYPYRGSASRRVAVVVEP